jgi:hypothetical protein
MPALQGPAVQLNESLSVIESLSQVTTAGNGVRWSSSATAPSLKAANQRLIPTLNRRTGSTLRLKAAKTLGSTLNSLTATAHAKWQWPMAQQYCTGKTARRAIAKFTTAQSSMLNGPCRLVVQYDVSSLLANRQAGSGAADGPWHWHSCAHRKAARKRS